MTFKDKVQAVEDLIKKEVESDGTSATGDEVRKRAVAATFEGKVDEYMSIFTTEWDELAKLRPETNQNGNPAVFERNTTRSYLIGNGNCGAASTGNSLLWGVDLGKLKL